VGTICVEDASKDWYKDGEDEDEKMNRTKTDMHETEEMNQ